MNEKLGSKKNNEIELKPINNVNLERDSDKGILCKPDCGDSACAACDGVCWIG